MSISRRKFLGWVGAAGLSATIGKSATASTNKHFTGYPGSFAILHDTTLCVGCRSCEAACNKVNDLPSPDKPFTDLSVLEKKRRTTTKHLRWSTNTMILKGRKNRYFSKNNVTTAWSRPVRPYVLYEPLQRQKQELLYMIPLFVWAVGIVWLPVPLKYLHMNTIRFLLPG